MTTKSPRKVYAAHLRLFVIGEELAREEGIGKVLDLISRDQELRTDFFIIVAKGTTAEQVLKILSIPLEKIPANKMFQSLQTSEKAWAATSGIDLNQLLAFIVSEGQRSILTGIEIIGDPKAGEGQQNLQTSAPPAVLNFNGMAAFNKAKLIGWLDEGESIGTNYVLNKVQSTIINIPCTDEGLMGLELLRAKSEVKGTVKNETPKVTVSIQGEANIADVECPEVDLTKSKTIDEMEKKAEENTKSKIEAALKKAQEDFKSDIFGFGEAIHRGDPEYWKKHKSNWDAEFASLPVEIKVDIKIRRTGTVGNSFLKVIGE